MYILIFINFEREELQDVRRVDVVVFVVESLHCDEVIVLLFNFDVPNEHRVAVAELFIKVPLAVELLDFVVDVVDLYR